MKTSSVAIVLILLAMLVALGALQYVWLGQISDGERARLQKSLDTDAARFAEDFDREIQSAYFNFSLDAEQVRARNYAAFAERVDAWQSKAAYPNLVKDFYFIDADGDAPILIYDREKRAFVESGAGEEIGNLRAEISNQKDFAALDADLPAIFAPVHDEEKRLEKIIIRGGADAGSPVAPPFETPKKIGYLVIRLDRATIENQILPDLVKKYFSEGEGADYKIAVKENASGKIIFRNGDANSENENADATAKFFNVSPDNFSFFINRNTTAASENGRTTTNRVVIARSFEKRETDSTARDEDKQAVNFEIQKGINQSPPRVRVFDRQTSPVGAWTLTARHASGSLENFITNTRRKNLTVSFGILSLLGLSVVLIFVSAQRARSLAQRQVDFVSSVSHEFRTPLAVIRSAGENLTDGVVRNQMQVSRYGDLIKREGMKLSQMVEQILEFAGARSGKRRYDFRETEIKNVLETALCECRPLLDEKDFAVERDIAEHLPPVVADANALTQAVQNLIVNAVKYSNGNAWLKVAASSGGGKIKIVVEDKGIGISPRDAKNIFAPFYRSKAVVDEQIHGNGLGLSLVKQTVEAHGGKVSVESQIGRGSKFTILLPRGRNLHG